MGDSLIRLRSWDRELTWSVGAFINNSKVTHLDLDIWLTVSRWRLIKNMKCTLYWTPIMPGLSPCNIHFKAGFTLIHRWGIWGPMKGSNTSKWGRNSPKSRGPSCTDFKSAHSGPHLLPSQTDTASSSTSGIEESPPLLSHIYSYLPPQFTLPTAEGMFPLQKHSPAELLQCWTCSLSVLSGFASD